MAGQAAKKQQRNATTTSEYYFYVVCAVTAIYVFFRVILNFKSFTKWNYIGLGFFCLIHKLTYSFIKDSLNMGVKYDYALDVFIVNCVVQVLTILSDKFWLLYLVIPGYLIYKVGSLILNWVFTPEPMEDEKTKKKREKMERKAQHGKVKYIHA